MSGDPDRLQILLGLAEAVNASLDLRKVFWRAAESLRELVGCERAWLYRVGGEGELPAGFALEFGPPVRWTNLKAGDLAPAGQWVVEDPRPRIGMHAKGAWHLDLPLVCRDQVIGILQVETPASRPIEPELPFLQQFGRLLALAVDHASAYNLIRHLQKKLERENLYLREEIVQAGGFTGLVGDSPAMQAVRQAIGQVAATDSTVLILGETGTGKELVARAIHEQSPRRKHLLIKVNCAALSPSLIASELFGHEAGAFTGAARRRIGRFELAQHGTVFLDEVGEIPADVQVMLLRVLQERVIERVGGNQPIPLDVRVIAATHRDLLQRVQEGKFRADLFYRLNVFPIQVAALRQRKEDIPALVRHFLARLDQRWSKRIAGVSPRSLALLQEYHWPGNVRELENILERAGIVSRGEQLEIDPAWLAAAPPAAEASTALADVERQTIIKALNDCGGKVYGQGGAAAALGLKPTTLYGKMRKHAIRKEPGSTRYQ